MLRSPFSKQFSFTFGALPGVMSFCLRPAVSKRRRAAPARPRLGGRDIDDYAASDLFNSGIVKNLQCELLRYFAFVQRYIFALSPRDGRIPTAFGSKAEQFMKSLR